MGEQDIYPIVGDLVNMIHFSLVYLSKQGVNDESNFNCSFFAGRL
jgi:hypothetical protein